MAFALNISVVMDFLMGLDIDPNLVMVICILFFVWIAFGGEYISRVDVVASYSDNGSPLHRSF